METATGKPAGAASPSASSARAISAVRSRDRRDLRGGPLSSLLGVSLCAQLDELHARGAAAWAFARQDGIDHLEVARQALPGRRRFLVARAQRARLVGHLSLEFTRFPVSPGPSSC